MPADPIVDCLQRLTDYDAFERLCSDVMAGLNYKDIEPLGGQSDRGRDAIFISRTDPREATLFAYSVRSDWKVKLREDCTSIQKNGHECHRVVFACTSDITPNEKDAAKQRVHERFGWDLDIYDLERLRIQLVGPQRHLVPKHPHIFCHPWFQTRGGLSIAFGRDTIVIDHVASDHALATWLARRLRFDGYSTWCFGSAPMAGETPDDTVRTLLDNRALRYLPILTDTSLQCADFVARCVLAGAHDGILLPCIGQSCNTDRLGTRIAAIQPIRFDRGWATGLRTLLDVFEAQHIPRDSDAGRNRAIVLRSFVPEPVTLQTPEPLVASVFPVTTLPDALLVYRTATPPPPQELADGRRNWAFSELASGVYASFQPPADVAESWGVSPSEEVIWRDVTLVKTRNSRHVILELLRRCLDVACCQAGLSWCADRHLWYFSSGATPQRSVAFVDSEGQPRTVGVTGFRQYGYGVRATVYHYQLAPVFRPGFDADGNAWITARIYARVSLPDGTPFSGKAITRRRRHLAKSWWNQHWLARTLGVMQALANSWQDVVIGTGSYRVVVSTSPMRWDCPVSVDEGAVARLGDFQEEMAALRFIEDDEDGADADNSSE